MSITQYFLSSFVTLFIVIDPIMAAPIFAALTRHEKPSQRLLTAVQAALIAFLILLFFGFFGDKILTFTGISMAAFRTSGGFLLFLLGFTMFFTPDSMAKAKTPGANAAARDNIAFFPVGMPLLAGPGSIATVMLLLTNENHGLSLIGILCVVGAVFLTLALGVVICFFSSAITSYLGKTGVNMISRILGMFLMALSTQYLFDGIHEGLLARF